MALTLGNRRCCVGQFPNRRVGLFCQDVLFGRKGNGLGIYLRMSGVVALGSLLVQVTYREWTSL